MFLKKQVLFYFYIVVHLYMYCGNSSFLLEFTTDSNTLTLNTTIYNNGHILRFFDIYRNFSSTEVKRSVIISNKGSLYGLPHELPNNFRLNEIRKEMKISRHHRIIT